MAAGFLNKKKVASVWNSKEMASGRQILKQARFLNRKKWLVAAARLLNAEEVASGRQLLKQQKSS